MNLDDSHSKSDIASTFAADVARWRDQANLGKTEAAKLAGVTVKTWDSWENGIAPPREHELRRAIHAVRTFLTSPPASPDDRSAWISTESKINSALTAGFDVVAEFELFARTQLSARRARRRPHEDAITSYANDAAGRALFELAQLHDLESALADSRRQPLATWLPYPAFITRPWRYQLKRQRIMFPDPTERRPVLSALKRRYRAWRLLATQTSIRWLIHPESHAQYLREMMALGTPRMTLADVQAQVDETRRLLSCYENLHVGYVDEPVATVISIFGSTSATMFGHLYSPWHEASKTGVRGIVITQPTAVQALRHQFDIDWRRANIGPRNDASYLALLAAAVT